MAVVLIFPYGYSDRLILPMYPLLIPYAAFALEPALRLVSDRWAQYRQRPHIWLYLGYAGALVQRLIWPANGSETADLWPGLLLPVVALTVARLTRHELLHRIAGSALFAAAAVRIGMAGSLSPKALHDPLFWLLAATVSAGLSGLLRRRRIAATAAATIAGGCVMVAVLLPFTLNVGPGGLRESFAALTRHAGVAGAICLLGLWVHAIVPRGAGETESARVRAGARGALLAALVLSLAGSLPTAAEAFGEPLVMLGVLLGLAEAKPRSTSPGALSRKSPQTRRRAS